jgi:hypothetical protein
MEGSVADMEHYSSTTYDGGIDWNRKKKMQQDFAADQNTVLWLREVSSNAGRELFVLNTSAIHFLLGTDHDQKPLIVAPR